MAALYGVQTGYRDTGGRWQDSPLESVAEVLRALGAELDGKSLHGRGRGAGRGTSAGWRDASRGACRADPRADRQVAAAIRARKLELCTRVLEPVLVAWDGSLPDLVVRLPSGDRRDGQSGLCFTLRLEGGEERRWWVDTASVEPIERVVTGGTAYVAYRATGLGVVRTGASARVRAAVTRGRRLPLGYHRLRVECGGLSAEATIISAPRRCWMPGCGAADHRQAAGKTAGVGSATGTTTAADGTGGGDGTADSSFLGTHPREWGLFAPLYALRSERDWGAGDLAELERLCDWVGRGGGSVIATLPLLAAYLDQPFEPAPYRPVSRLFWNEFYLPVDQLPEWELCGNSKEIAASVGSREEAARLRAEPLVDYRAVMALKRQALEDLCRCFFARADTARREAFEDYVRTHPHAEEYAAFRARVEEVGADWTGWPSSLSKGDRDAAGPANGGGDAAERRRYHLYCQWQMDEQLGGLALRADPAPVGMGRAPAGLLLDLPVGVHPGGFDTWRWPELFAPGMSVGAPPDTFFADGQDWAAPPLAPERMRQGGHQYLAEAVRHHMRHARYLRVDHVMSLHRLFWIPEKSAPADGVYVGYPADELYAILCLESHRNRAVVIGEDLGTVPPGVRAAMRSHGTLGTWAMQMSLRPRAAQTVVPATQRVVASLGTHDMFPFAGFLRGDDIVARVDTGQLDEAGARRARAARRRLVERLAAALSAGEGATDWAVQTDADLVQLASLAHAFLARSRAHLALLNLDDLLLETRPQNLPGTGHEYGNWRRKIAGSGEDVRKVIEEVAGQMAGLN